MIVSGNIFFEKAKAKSEWLENNDPYPSKDRHHADNRSNQGLVDETHRKQSRCHTDNIPLALVNAAAITAAKTVARGVVPTELDAAVQPKSVCSRK